MMHLSKNIVLAIAALVVGGGSFWFGYYRSASAEEPVVSAEAVENSGKKRLSSFRSRPRRSFELDADGRRILDIDSLVPDPSAEPAAHDPESLTELLRAIEKLCDRDPIESGDVVGELQMLEMVSMIGPEDIRAAVEAAEAVKAKMAPEEDFVMLEVVMQRWSEIDGAAAMAYVDEHELEYEWGVMASWAKTDPVAALAAVDLKSVAEKAKEGEWVAPYIQDIFYGYASVDFSSAWQSAMDLEPNLRASALEGITYEIDAADGQKRAAIFSRISEVENEQLASTLREDVYFAWGETEPVAALEALRQDGAVEDFGAVGVDIATDWALFDAEAALAWTQENLSAELHAEVVEYTLEDLSEYDAREAVRMIEVLEPGELADAARRQLAGWAAEDTPHAALDAARGIGDAAIREEILHELFIEWHSSDREAAVEGFTRSGAMAEEEVRRLAAELSAEEDGEPIPGTDE